MKTVDVDAFKKRFCDWLFRYALFIYQLNQLLTDMDAAVVQTYCPECDQYFRLYFLLTGVRQPVCTPIWLWEKENGSFKNSISTLFIAFQISFSSFFSLIHLMLLLITIIITIITVWAGISTAAIACRSMRIFITSFGRCHYRNCIFMTTLW